MANNNTTSRFILWGTVVLGIALIVFIIVQLTSATNEPRNDIVPAVNEITAFDHVQGSDTAPITLVEYSDFECPACAAYHPIAKRLIEEHGEQIRFVYRHFPLTQIHKNAEAAAQAAEAAGVQGTFWEMHDLIFEKQRFWAEERNADALFQEYAQTLELDIDQFNIDRASKLTKDKVFNDRRSGTRAGVQGTPTFFVNGRQITNPRSYDEFRTLVLGETN